MSQQPRKPGRPKGDKLANLHVDIRPELRKKINEYKAKNRWTLRAAVESILETFFGK